ncbi:hypothetical protein BDP27DRAFT_1287345 [Rhodocollybia butyracea]|uniref:GST N-terminal domain-containing protein n=1 Tax=Rhodocollybia butyracea TaxID=206335 RepID=A0A9P5UBX1_9AGAR|nr:hypothetical protein BDP27DRAFT_1287345 [Rhodocollybia butyracea]
MTDDKTIILYDIPFAEPGVCWSPNTWKTRYCLNYKGLPYRTEWIHYPDIKPLCLKIGAAPTDFEDDGVTPLYTLPVIYDPTTKRTISESFDIAIYLDITYPNTPRVLPEGTHGLQNGFSKLVMARTPRSPWVRLEVVEKLPPGKSQDYFRRTREATYGTKFEEWGPRGRENVKAWAEFQKGLFLLSDHYTKAKEETGGNFLCGDSPTFADFALASILQWCKAGYGSESEEWKDIVTWQKGKWGDFVQSLDNYTQVV